MTHIHTLKALAAAALALSLAACGSSGSDPAAPPTDPTTPTTPTDPSTPTPDPSLKPATAVLQGIWQSPAGAASALSAAVLPDGKLWSIITSDGVTRLVKASLSAQTANFGGTGKSYTLGAGAASSNVSATATTSVIEKTSLNGTLTVGSGQPEAFALAYQARYDTPAVLSDYAGAWQATLGPGVVNWTITSTGVLSGTRTTGCTYSGRLGLRPEQKAVVDVSVAEDCAGTVVQLGGVAVFNADKTRLSMLMTTANEAIGVAVNLAR